MTITKADYILRSLAKIAHKRWELFVVSRIIHQLDDDIEFVTQQLVRGQDGQRYLTDLFFPQLGVHLEIDERHHIKGANGDRLRELDIVQVTEHQIKRIKIFDDFQTEKPINEIRQASDEFLDVIRTRRREVEATGNFIPWDWETRYSAEPVIKRGHLDISDNVTFRLQAEALRCFGFAGKSIQRGTWNIPDGSGDWVWFPRLYHHSNWNNELSVDGKTLRAHAVNDEGKKRISRDLEKRSADVSQGKLPENVIVFAKAKDSLGHNLLRYVGTFQVNVTSSSDSFIQFDRLRAREDVRV